MDSDTETFGNSTSKNLLQLQLDQPTKYADDIKSFDNDDSDSDEESEDQEGELKGGDGEEEEKKTLTSSNKDGIPAIYQVEPGCTALSCYSAIITFIVMTMGVFWLLLISPPKTSMPVTIPPGQREHFLYDTDDIDDGPYANYSTTSSIEAVVEAAVSSAKNLIVDDTGT